MCQRVKCASCGKPTYAGCGRHIEQVLGDVPAEARCHCREATGDAAQRGPSAPSFLRRLLGG